MSVRITYAIAAFTVLILIFPAAAADVRVAILDFELNDLTLIPRTPEEVVRTASIKPLLEEKLAATYGYEIVGVDPQTQQSANKGFGYLFDHSDFSANLGRTVGADWIIVGRVHKASFLFVYFKARLINTHTQRVVRDLVVEVKGPQKVLTRRGIDRLASYLDQAIGQEMSR